MKGWVYILSNKAMPNLVKVGFSTKDPESRANELHTTGVPYRFVVEYDALVNEPFSVEQKSHALLKAYHENKEWFRCDVTTAIIAIRQAANGTIILESNKEDFNNDSAEVSQYRKSAEQGDANAQFNLGWSYANGKGITKNELQAVYWYSKAAEQGNGSAQCNLGFMYQNGYGVTKDSQKAVEWYRKSAEQVDLQGQKNLNNSVADIYHEAVKYYEQKEYNKALPLFQQSAEQGNANAQSYLGLMYEYGEGVTKDNQKAVEWYRKAAEQGSADVEWRLGFMYQNGYGVIKDDQKAVEWYRKAAEQGSADAQWSLGFMYQNSSGVTKDYQKAMEWYRKAAEQGYVYAQNDLGRMYQNGEGVTKDNQKAVEWYRKAAEQGDANAQASLSKMSGLFSRLFN